MNSGNETRQLVTLRDSLRKLKPGEKVLVIGLKSNQGKLLGKHPSVKIIYADKVVQNRPISISPNVKLVVMTRFVSHRVSGTVKGQALRKGVRFVDQAFEVGRLRDILLESLPALVVRAKPVSAAAKSTPPLKSTEIAKPGPQAEQVPPRPFKRGEMEKFVRAHIDMRNTRKVETKKLAELAKTTGFVIKAESFRTSVWRTYKSLSSAASTPTQQAADASTPPLSHTDQLFEILREFTKVELPVVMQAIREIMALQPSIQENEKLRAQVTSLQEQMQAQQQEIKRLKEMEGRFTKARALLDPEKGK